MPKYRNIQCGLYRHRQKFIPKTPTSQDDFDAMHDWLKIDGKETIVKYDGKTPCDGRILFFSTDMSLKILSKAKTFTIDGTFKSCPLLWHQVVIFMAQVSESMFVPVGFAFLPNKSYNSYKKLFKGMLNYMEKNLDLSIDKFSQIPAPLTRPTSQ